ncbi:hypothetical protein SO802_025107 [Lithocarpus litseifolius]|uniref:DUF4283 domain-containing protein n=1 Tax=Lithocarpus litseifolius TaxID=425828 RepID=A0AAW2BYA6_9ROSI
MPDVKVTRETKDRIWAPGSKTLIVKVYDRTVGFNYLTFKINTLWKPSAKMDCVDLGKDFFLIKITDDDDYDKEIGSVTGPVLRIDSFIASGSRGSYARFCVQVDLEKALINMVRVGRLRQKIMYEELEGRKSGMLDEEMEIRMQKELEENPEGLMDVCA